MRRMAVATAISGLRDHPVTSGLVVTLAAAGLAASLPVVRLVDLSRQTGSRLLLEASAQGAEPGWAVARSPGELHAEALRLLFQALGGAALAAFAVGAVGALLVFAARASERVAETAVRRAVGARRRTLLAAALVEGAFAAAGVLVLGGAAGWLLGDRAIAGWPGPVAPGAATPLVATAVATLIVLLAGAGLGVVFAPRRRLTDASAAPAGLTIPSAQLGLALVVLTASALMVRHATSGQAAGARPAEGEVFSGSSTLADPALRATRYASLLASLRAGSRFDSVTLASAGTVVGLGTLSIATTDCGICPWGGLPVPWHAVPTTHRFVSADSFQALGVRVIAGRGISAVDTWEAPRIAVVSRSLAQRHFQNGEAIGRRMLLGNDDRVWHTVVGIVDDPPSQALGSALLPAFTVYASVLQHPPVNVELLVRSRPGASGGPSPRAFLAGALGGSAGRVREAAERELAARERMPVEWFGRLFAAEGWAILLIAAVASGLQMSLWVRSRSAELGLRRAVGATRRRVLGAVLLRAGTVGLLGTAMGLVIGPAVWGALGTVVRGLPAWDTGLVVRFAGLLILVATAGALGPAWRVARTDPARLLAPG